MSMFRSQFGRAIALMLVSGAVVTVPTAAQARSVDRSDPRGDVTRFSGVDGNASAAPRRANGDIVRTVFRHKEKRVRIRIDFARLQRSFESASILTPMVTNEGIRREIVFVIDRTEGDPWYGRAVLLYRPNDQPTKCAIHHSLNYRDDVAIFGLARTCIGNPRWVRIGVEVRTQDPFKGPPSPHYADNALMGALTSGEEPPFSSPIYRG